MVCVWIIWINKLANKFRKVDPTMNFIQKLNIKWFSTNQNKYWRSSVELADHGKPCKVATFVRSYVWIANHRTDTKTAVKLDIMQRAMLETTIYEKIRNNDIQNKIKVTDTMDRKQHLSDNWETSSSTAIRKMNTAN